MRKRGPGPTRFACTRSQAYVTQAIRLSTTEASRSSVDSRVADATTADAVKTQLDGAGGLLAPVLAIDAASPAVVTLQALRIIGGDSPAAAAGGGIRFEGSGELVLIDNVIEGNRAGDGGGIHFLGTGEFPRLIRRDNLILANIADARGGGINMQGADRMVEGGISGAQSARSAAPYLHFATSMLTMPPSPAADPASSRRSGQCRRGGVVSPPGRARGDPNVTKLVIASATDAAIARRNRATRRGGASAAGAAASATRGACS